MIKIGLIGCGNIGHIIANHAEGIEIVALFDIFFDRAKELETMTGATAHEHFESFISEDFDIVVELEGLFVLRSLVFRSILRSTTTKDGSVLLLSIAGLLRRASRKAEWSCAAERFIRLRRTNMG